jgi:O-antigen ligase
MPTNNNKPERSNRFDDHKESEKASFLSRIVFILLCAMLVFSTVVFGAVDIWALGALSGFAGLIVILWLIDAWLKKEFQFSSNKLQLPLFGLILIGLIQLLPLRSFDISGALMETPSVSALSVAPYATRFAVVQLIVYFVFLAAALTFINNSKRLKAIVSTIIIFGTLMSIYGILQRLANIEGVYGARLPEQAVSFASFINQHHFAAFMEMTVGLTLGLLFGEATKKDKRLLLIIAAVIMGMAVIFTGSRGGMVGLLSVISFIVTANLLKKPTTEVDSEIENKQNYRRKFSFVAGGLALIIVLFGAVIFLGGDESLMRGIGLVNNLEDVSNGRTHFWQIALKIFADYPVLGAGLDAYGTAFTRYDTWSGYYRVEQAHNDYLQTLADAGIAGFGCVAAFIYLLFRRSITVITNAKDSFHQNVAIGALAGCVGILLHSFFDFPLRTPSNALFFLILVALATTSFNKTKIHRKQKTRD